MCRRRTVYGLWHVRVRGGNMRKGRRGGWLKRKLLAFDLCPAGEKEGGEEGMRGM